MFISVLGLFFLLFAVSNIYSRKKLVLSSVSNSIDSEIAEVILREAYNKINVDISISDYQGLRAFEHSNQNNSDGETNRIAEIETEYLEHVKIPVPISRIDVNAYTVDPNINITEWTDLKGFRVCLKLGVKFAELRLAEIEGINLCVTSTASHQFQLLADDKVDVVIAPKKCFDFVHMEKEYPDFAPREQYLESFDLYHYINKKHEKLIPKITSSLQSLEKNGFISITRNEIIDRRKKSHKFICQ